MCGKWESRILTPIQSKVYAVPGKIEPECQGREPLSLIPDFSPSSMAALKRVLGDKLKGHCSVRKSLESVEKGGRVFSVGKQVLLFPTFYKEVQKKAS